MSYLWSLIWLVLSLLVSVLTVKYYVPFLEKNKKTDDAESSASTPDLVLKTDDSIISKKNLIIIILCCIYCAVCGYFAFANTTSEIARCKMTIEMMVLCVVLFTDLKLRLIPNLLSIVVIALRLVLFIIELIVDKPHAVSLLFNGVLAGLLCVVFLFLMSRLTRGGIGMGDIKILASLGFLCGARAVFFTLLIALFASSIVSIVMLLIKKMKMKDALPMGPFVWIAFGMTIIFSLA